MKRVGRFRKILLKPQNGTVAPQSKVALLVNIT